MIHSIASLCLTAAASLVAVVLALAQDAPNKLPEFEPEQVFHKAIARFRSFEGKDPLLQGVKDAKPRFERENGRLKNAALIFSANANPPGKGPATPTADRKPFFYFSAQIWAGKSDQPPGNAHHFRWKGESYTAWVQVYGSDKDLVAKVREAVDEPIMAPP